MFHARRTRTQPREAFRGASPPSRGSRSKGRRRTAQQSYASRESPLLHSDAGQKNAAPGGLPLAPLTSAARSRSKGRRFQRHPPARATRLPRPAKRCSGGRRFYWRAFRPGCAITLEVPTRPASSAPTRSAAPAAGRPAAHGVRFAPHPHRCVQRRAAHASGPRTPDRTTQQQVAFPSAFALKRDRRPCAPHPASYARTPSAPVARSRLKGRRVQHHAPAPAALLPRPAAGERGALGAVAGPAHPDVRLPRGISLRFRTQARSPASPDASSVLRTRAKRSSLARPAGERRALGAASAPARSTPRRSRPRAGASQSKQRSSGRHSSAPALQVEGLFPGVSACIVTIQYSGSYGDLSPSDSIRIIRNSARRSLTEWALYCKSRQASGAKSGGAAPRSSG